jgi:hypothetical protein
MRRRNLARGPALRERGETMWGMHNVAPGWPRRGTA